MSLADLRPFVRNQVFGIIEVQFDYTVDRYWPIRQYRRFPQCNKVGNMNKQALPGERRIVIISRGMCIFACAACS